MHGISIRSIRCWWRNGTVQLFVVGSFLGGLFGLQGGIIGFVDAALAVGSVIMLVVVALAIMSIVALPFDVNGKLRFGIADLMSVVLVFGIAFGTIQYLPAYLSALKPFLLFWCGLFLIDILCTRIPKGRPARLTSRQRTSP
jgi:hypothetical protein